ncbi:MAG: hypothetical protein OEU92_01475 [Alphaproteobacteria bacterium]|nr:hypothetical protein [Alphaproteobacteria bacterium]
MLIESHDAVEALFDHAAHQPVELLQLRTLIEGDADIMLGPATGEHGSIALQKGLRARSLLGCTLHRATDIASGLLIISAF